MIECPELEAAFGSAVLVGRSGALGPWIGCLRDALGISVGLMLKQQRDISQWGFFCILWDIIGIYEDIMGFCIGRSWDLMVFNEFYYDMM
jgi:hypothetical protein